MTHAPASSSVTSASRRSSILADLGIFPQDTSGATGTARPAETGAAAGAGASAAAGGGREAGGDGDVLSRSASHEGNNAANVGHRDAPYTRDLVRISIFFPCILVRRASSLY